MNIKYYIVVYNFQFEFLFEIYFFMLTLAIIFHLNYILWKL